MTILISLLTGVSFFFIILYFYPKIEMKFMGKFRYRLEWVEDKFDKLFWGKYLTQNRLYLISFGPTFLFFSFGYLATFSVGLLFAVPFAILFGVFGWFLPWMVLSIIYKLYLSKFNAQLVDSLAMIANSLKSGLSMLQGIQVVVKNMPNPIAQEFNLLLSQHSLGTNLDDAFINMEHRIPSEDLQMVITSITILSETGGDLTETFETIMHTIGERNKVQGKIKSLTYMGMFQAIILSSLPLALGFALYMMNPAQMMLFFTTKLGWALIVLIVILLSSAFYVIKKIVTIDV